MNRDDVLKAIDLVQHSPDTPKMKDRRQFLYAIARRLGVQHAIPGSWKPDGTVAVVHTVDGIEPDRVRDFEHVQHEREKVIAMLDELAKGPKKPRHRSVNALQKRLESLQ